MAIETHEGAAMIVLPYTAVPLVYYAPKSKYLAIAYTLWHKRKFLSVIKECARTDNSIQRAESDAFVIWVDTVHWRHSYKIVLDVQNKKVSTAPVYVAFCEAYYLLLREFRTAYKAVAIDKFATMRRA